MRRRWVRIVAILVGILAVLCVGLVVALRLTAPTVDVGAPQERKPVPASWLASEDASAAQPAPSPPEPSVQTPATVSASDDRPAPFATTGALAFSARGRPFGEESYEIRLDAAGLTLSSTGQFRFRAVVATLRVAFEQRLEADDRLIPTRYEAAFDAPLGFDRRVSAEITDGVARIVSGNAEQAIDVDGDAVVLGTFATYALFPVLFPLRERDGTASFDVLALGGPPGTEEETSALPPMSVERLAPIRIRSEGQTIVVDAYLVESTLGGSLLLAKGREFVALVAGTVDEPLTVYRSDFFPDGFEILDRVDRLPSLSTPTVP